MKSEYFITGDISTCYGCNACYHFCPVGAIELEKNNQGFSYPIVREDLCIECGRCREVCPTSIEKNGRRGTIYQVAHKNTDVLLDSQCGGAFTAISDFVFSRGGSVYGAAFSEDLSVKHIRANEEQGRNYLRGSKYVQSTIEENVFEQMEEDIKNKIWILFTGTPCQCAMMKLSYGFYEKLIICDFICHGTPSPDVWDGYLQYIREKEGITISEAKFRNKRCRGIGNHTESYWSEDGKEFFSNDYAGLFYSHLAHRENCFSCQFAKQERYSDITIGGFLEPSDFDTEYDSSMVIVNSPKGKMVFKGISKAINYKESKLPFYKNQPCLYHPVPRPYEYNAFWEDYQYLSMKELLLKYSTDEIKKRFHIEILGVEK